MARNDEGEFELILGNRQLISVFLIMVILLGLLFSIGYILGRNSAPVVASTTPATNAAAVERTAAGAPSAADADTTTAPDQQAARAPARRASPVESAPAPETKQEAARADAAKPAPDRPKAVANEGKPALERKADKIAASAAVRSLDEPPPGSYWQVVATSRPEAEIVAEAIGKRGLHSVITPASKAGLFRVLVGPLGSPSAMGEARADLEAAGFKSVIPKKY